MSTRRRIVGLLRFCCSFCFAASSMGLLHGCNRSPAEPSAPPATDAATTPQADGGPPPGTDAGTAGSADAAPSCFTNPTTYLEIINACTDAQAVDKAVDLSPMNLADGGLQPLP